MNHTAQQALFKAMCLGAKLPAPTAEHRFHPSGRRWRFDYAWIPERIALEVEGGIWIQGRHSRGAGFLKDMEKYNEAAALGWRVLRTTPQHLLTTDTINLLRRVL